ncbi:TonB-dependent receptor domain-containing protein [Marinigracilibium pacificum]|uniref:TonB-dependent receptor n=1 Tax=Marinigracilibium pacificum TaxID=2729599 RepID=A0A848J105_9BACT|nr:TonB-dependent receptor [Marinigracilibium pacificum]NMM49038.1 TonB-dependent receptor [Marinigracilibium pacificum]
MNQEVPNKAYLLLVIFFLCFTTNAQESGKLSGNVKDQNSQPVPFANVAILNAGDSSLVSGAVTNERGDFSIGSPKSSGKYMLRLSAIGFETIYTESFNASGQGYTKHWSELSLPEVTQNLEGVEVRATRPTVIVEADKTVVDIENSALTQGNTALEVLEKSPGVWIDQDGNIQLNGKQGVLVMIDDRRTYMTAKELQALLNSMSANNIKNIELITNPSARYDAEGTAGIININLKKGIDTGFNGSVTMGYRYNKRNAYNGGVNFNYKKGKISSFVQADYNRWAHWRELTMRRDFITQGEGQYMEQVANHEPTYDNLNINAGFDFEINDKHSVGVMVKAFGSEGEGNFDIRTYNYGEPTFPGFIKADNDMDEESTNKSVNFHYVAKLDSSGSRLSMDLDYVKRENDNYSTFTNQVYISEGGEFLTEENFRNINPTFFDIYSAKMDYTKPFGPGKNLEAGWKLSRVVSDNNVMFSAFDQGEWVLDQNRSNHFIYKENIYAAYASYGFPLTKKISVKAGLRYEKTVAEGESVTLNEVNDRSYDGWFPSLFINNNVSENYQVGLNYSRRIQRPNYGMLNPYFLYLDRYTVATGNPNLKPVFTHSIELNQTFKKKFIVGLGYNYSKDMFTEVPDADVDSRLVVFTPQNLDDMHDAYARFIIPVDVAEWFSINNTAVVSYKQFSSVIEGELVSNDQVNTYFQSNFSFVLPKNFKLELTGTYVGPNVWGLYQIQEQYWVNFGVKKSVMKDKLSLSLNFSDIFHTQRFKGTVDLPDQNTQIGNVWASQNVNFTLRYTFSQGKQFKVNTNRGNLEELNRAGGN